MSAIDHDHEQPDPAAAPATPFTSHCPLCLTPLEYQSCEASTRFHNGEWEPVGMNHKYTCPQCKRTTGWLGGWYKAAAAVKGWTR